MPRERNESLCNSPIEGDYAYSVKPHYRHATCKECGRPGLIWRRNTNGRYILTTHESGDFHECTGRARSYNVAQTPTEPTSDPTPAQTTPTPIDVEAIVQNVLARINVPQPTIDYDSIVERTRNLISLTEPQTIRIDPYNAPTVTIEHPHPKFERVLRWVSRRRNVWLYGPAGTGKTTAASNVANALGLPYYAMSCGPMTQEYGILGYRSADGTFIPGAIYKAFVDGGVFLFDEIDAASADCLVAINALLANGECMFGGQMLRKHPDFVVLGAANTVGTGASREYVGRAQIDAATLDRFVMVEWEYDTNLERRIASAYETPDALDWLDHVHNIRRTVDALGIRLIVGTRAVINGCEGLSAGIPWSEVEQDTIFSKTDADTVARIKASI